MGRGARAESVTCWPNRLGQMTSRSACESWRPTSARRRRRPRSPQCEPRAGAHAEPALHPRGGSRRACGARASGVEDRDEPAAQKPSGVEGRDEPAARQCACGKRERRVQAEPLSHQARRYPSRASPYCPSEATRTTSRDWARRQIYESLLTQGRVRPTTFGVGFRRLSCGGGRPPPALVFNHLTLYAAWCRRCTGREYGPARATSCFLRASSPLPFSRAGEPFLSH